MIFLPKTKLGKWSFVLIIAVFVLFFIGNFVVVAFNQTGGETIFDNLYISIPMLSAGLCGISSFVSGLISIIWKKERAIVVFISTFIGMLILFFLIGEFVVSH